MAIVLKYGAPGPVVLAGYAAGVGHGERERRKDSLRLWQQQQQQGFQAQQAYLDREQRAGLQQAAFAQQAGQAQLDREFRAEQQAGAFGFQAEQAGLRQAFESGEAEKERTSRAEEFRKREEFTFGRDTMEGLRSGELELPPAAERRLAQLEDGLAYAATLDPAQEQEFRQKYEEEKKSLYRLAQPRKRSPSADFNQGMVYVDPTGKGYDEPGPDRTPFNSRTGKPLFEQPEPVETVPFQGEEVPLKDYEDYRKSMEKQQSDYDKRFDKEDPTTDEQKNAFIKKYGQRPEVPKTAYELRRDQRAKSRGGEPTVEQPTSGAQQQSSLESTLDRMNRGEAVSAEERQAAYSEYESQYGGQISKVGNGGALDEATLKASRKFMPTIRNEQELQAAKLEAGDVFIGPDGRVHSFPER